MTHKIRRKVIYPNQTLLNKAFNIQIIQKFIIEAVEWNYNYNPEYDMENDVKKPFIYSMKKSDIRLVTNHLPFRALEAIINRYFKIMVVEGINLSLWNYDDEVNAASYEEFMKYVTKCTKKYWPIKKKFKKGKK